MALVSAHVAAPGLSPAYDPVTQPPATCSAALMLAPTRLLTLFPPCLPGHTRRRQCRATLGSRWHRLRTERRRRGSRALSTMRRGQLTCKHARPSETLALSARVGSVRR